MASAKDNVSKRLLTSALTVVLLAATVSSSAVSKANSLAGRSTSSRQERAVPFPRADRLRPHPDDPSRPNSCPCNEGRMTRIERQIASLLEKTDELTTQTTESRNNIASMMVTNRQLRSQVSQVMREKRSLETEIQTRQMRASSLTQDNGRLRAANERLVAKPPRGSFGNTPPVRSPLRELDDVVGNREAELVEMGLPVQVGTPQRGPQSRPRPSDLDAENFASSLLAVNTDIKDLTRKVEQLERRVAEQPQSREVPQPRGESDQVSEKITQLERLVLVALRSQLGDAAGQSRPQMRPQQGFPHRDPMEQPSAERLAIADTMSDEDLDAMVNVVERVQNKSPRKCAFSVASTVTTLGTDGVPSTIQFDHEFINKGGDFKMSQNRFVCEHAGFYFITFTVRSYDGKYLGVTLMKNSDIQTAIYADSSDRNVMQSQSVIVHLESGDRLWLRLAPSGNFAVHSGVHRYVTFSGFLVYKGF